jgi:hypothetical protein
VNARCIVERTGPRLDGFAWVAQPEGSYGILAGPMPDRWAVEGKQGADLRLRPASAVGPRGSLAVWIRLDRPYRSGRSAEESRQTILALDGLFDLGFYTNKTCGGFSWTWDRDLGAGAANINLQLPGLPGPQWVHLAFSWDAETGRADGWLDGTPLRTPGTPLQPWTTKEAELLALTPGGLAIGDLILSDETLHEGDVLRMVPAAYRGALDALLGARDLGEETFEFDRGRPVYENDLGCAEDCAGWIMEGPGEVTFEDGWMVMASERPDGPDGHIVHWPNVDFPADFVAEWEMRPISDYGLCIIFFCATGRNGEDLFDPTIAPRNGIFSQYTMGDINCYHISYYANTPSCPGRITSNMRKNHGFFVVANGPPGVAAGDKEAHAVRLAKRGAHVHLSVDGRKLIEFHDGGEDYGPVLGAGKIGFRQMQWMKAAYRHFRVYGL